MITLALDTATPAPSFALSRDGLLMAERTVVDQEGAGRRVAQDIHTLLGEADAVAADLGRIVVGVGPGGFTGLRIGMATALALGQALQIEVVGVCSLETLALGMTSAGAGRVMVPVIDARRREVYTAAYREQGAGLEIIAPPMAATVEAFDALLDRIGAECCVAGDGLARIAGCLDGRAEAIADGPAHRVRAANSIEWALGAGRRPVAPLYLRLPDAEVNRRLREGEPQ